MRKLFFTACLLVLVVPVSAVAQCPDDMPENGDWDGDGILNSDDVCCFTTSLWEDLSGDMCSEDFMSQDMNGNGVSALEEGTCCVDVAVEFDGVAVPTRSYCYRTLIEQTDAGVEEYCEEDDHVMVACDMLLLYDGMILYGEGDGQDELECGERGCICYTIGDYDKDDGFDDGVRDGPFDNCPADWNTADSEDGQSDADGDFFGDACDLCEDSIDSFLGSAKEMGEEEFQLAFLEAQCEIGGDDCPGAECVPRAIENPREGNGEDEMGALERILVGNFCSAPSDKDEDAYGDACDNCPDVYNESQSDLDSDGAGDMCDACPTNAQVTVQLPSMLNSDSDQVIDSCDNCPAVFNPDQLNHDGDNVGDACDLCPFSPEIGRIGAADADSDGFGDVCDPCPLDAEITGADPEYAKQYPDADSDGFADVCDNCASVANGEQKDADGDGIGDVCDNSFDDAEHPSSETGAVSFSGGGVISCNYSAAPLGGSGSLLSVFF